MSGSVVAFAGRASVWSGFLIIMTLILEQSVLKHFDLSVLVYNEDLSFGLWGIKLSQTYGLT